MIVRRYGKVIDTENMNNNHIYTYALDNNILYKIEINFKLEDINEFLKIILTFSSEKEGYLTDIPYNRTLKKPINKRPYDEIIDCLYDLNDILEKKTLLDNDIMKRVYMKWLEYPDVYFKIKELVEFKTTADIGLEKSIDLTNIIEELEKYNLVQKFYDNILFKIIGKIEKENIDTLNSYKNNEIININKQIENINKYLDYGIKNKKLIKIIKQ